MVWASRWPVALRGKFFLCYIVLFLLKLPPPARPGTTCILCLHIEWMSLCITVHVLLWLILKFSCCCCFHQAFQEWPDGQQVLTSISAHGRFEVERQTYDLTYLQCNTPARLRCQGETLELIRCTDNVWIWRASQCEKTYCWMKIRPVAHSLSMDFSKESVTFVCTSCQRPIEEACFWNYRPCESDEETYLCRDCSGDSDELLVRQSVRGISARYLLDIFPDLARNGTEKADPNFYEIAPVLAMGSKGLGFQKVCPRDGQPGCSIVDAVDPCYQGLVTHFVSWCWAYKLNDFVSAIAVWAQKEEQDIDCIFLWICFLTAF